MTGDETKPRAGSAVEGTRGHLREMGVVTASILVFSSDGHLLMGQKDPARKRVHRHVWHLPGGEVEEGESLEGAALRKAEQSVGLRLTPGQLTALPSVGEDEQVKLLNTGETVWCRTKLNRFEVRLDKAAAQLETQTQPGGDFVALRWLSPAELADVELIPSIREFFIRAGYIGANKGNHT